MLELALSFGAGLLTTLSPCVLPVLPIVLGSAGSRHRLAPLAVAAGMASAFTVVGVSLASVGASLGIGDAAVRVGGGVLLAVAGAALLSERLQARVASALGPLSGWAARRTGGERSGVAGHFALGALLGGVWSPCTGPTLGAAVGLASQASGIPRAAVVMFVFAVGASVPLVAAGYGARGVVARSGMLRRFAEEGKPAFGVVLLLVGAAIVLGIDKTIEAAILERLPAWWNDAVTRI
jgi:cytochrome c biogenesis protein CcdA